MSIFQNIMQWCGVLCIVSGIAHFIGSFNAAYTARITMEQSATIFESATHEEIHKVLRALDLFMVGCAALLVGTLVLVGLHFAKRRAQIDA